MAPPFTPLLDPGKYDDPSFMNTPSELAVGKLTTPQKQQINPVIPPELATMEDRLKESGSGTSTLTSIAAWLGAAKGDFRGIQAIEEQKRRTALAKSMSPEVIKVNNMVNSGKWEEAQSYVNQMANTYGQRAPELIPYLDAMAARIAKKQEGWENLRGVYNLYKETVTEENVNYPVLKALEKAVERRDNLSETSLQGFLTRSGVHVQNIDGRLTLTQPLTGETRTEMLPAVVKASDFDNFAGNTVASANGLDMKQMADLRNGRTVTTDTGEVIKPGSEKDKTIRTQFNRLLPINQRLEMAKLAQIEPGVTLQLLKDNGLLKTAIRDFGEGAIDKALTETYTRDTQRQIAVIKGTEAEKTITPAEGFVVHLDEANPDTFFSVKTDPTTINQVTSSGGKLGIIPPNMMPTVQQNQAAIQGLDTATQMLREGTKLETLGDRLSQGVLQKISSLPYIGYPIGEKTEARQLIKTIINTAIEQIENTAVVSPGQIRGGDRDDIKQLKRFASGDFKSEKDVADAITRTRLRLVNMTKMLTGQAPPQTTPGTEKRVKTPVEILAPAVSKAQKGKQQQSQFTRDPYGPGGIQIPPDIEEGIRKAVEATGKAAKETGKATSGQQRVVLPGGPKSTAPQSGQPTGQPQQQQGYSEEDEVQRAMREKRIQRGMK